MAHEEFPLGSLPQGRTAPGVVGFQEEDRIDIGTDEGLRTFELFSKTDAFKKQQARLEKIERAGEVAAVKKQQDKEIGKLLVQFGQQKELAIGDSEVGRGMSNLQAPTVQLVRAGLDPVVATEMHRQAMLEIAGAETARQNQAKLDAAAESAALKRAQEVKDKTAETNLAIRKEALDRASEERQELTGRFKSGAAVTELTRQRDVSEELASLIPSLSPEDQKIIRDLKNLGAPDEVIIRSLRSKGLI